jgi:cytochrome c peroxidase
MFSVFGRRSHICAWLSYPLFSLHTQQYVDAGSGRLMMLPTDLVLLQDDKFLTHVKIYAADSAKFNEDFTAAFQKLEELGTSNLQAVTWA